MAARPQGSTWMAYVLAGLVAIVAIAALLAYPNRANGPEAQAGSGLAFSLPKAPPSPEGPKMPNPPIPVPR